ncbi:outer membrane protein assembly factor BamD [Lacinutrix salivirga]
MKKLFYILVTFTILSSCSDYQRMLKNEDIGEKFKFAENLYDQGKYSKANKLFAQIVPNYRGKPQAEKLMYLYSDTFMKMKNYYVASHQFQRFVEAYPRSEKVADAAFYSAKSAYMLSPVYSKDQTETQEAIDKLQLFINLYPKSQYTEEANKLVQELDYKLERKAFEIAKQFNHVSDYQAALKAFDNFVFNFPGSTFREQVAFLKLDSAYKLAVNSIEVKKQDRLETAKAYYENFKSNFATSQDMDKANKMIEVINEQLQQYSTKP